MEEFLVDSMKHTDDGSVDRELADLSLASFRVKGVSIFPVLLRGELANFDWTAFYNAMQSALDPTCAKVQSMMDI